MLFDYISQMYFFLLAASPFIALVLFISIFFMDSNERTIAFVTSAFMIWIGCTWISPIDEGSWGFGVIGYIFAIPFWFSIGLMLGQFLFYWSNSKKNRKAPKSSYFLLFCFTILVLHFGYAVQASEKSFTLIEDFLKGKISEEKLTKNGHHKRERFAFIVNSRLEQRHISSQIPETQIRFLASQGINIYHCDHTPTDLIGMLLKRYEDTGPSIKDESMSQSIDSLCANPNLRKEDFMRIAKINPTNRFWTILQSPTFDEERCLILKDQLQSLLQKPEQELSRMGTDTEEITSLINRLDKFLEEKKVNR